MSQFNPGDFVIDISTSEGDRFRYGRITSIVGDMIYCMWSQTRRQLELKQYSSRAELWTNGCHLRFLDKNNDIKEIKKYGIAIFCEKNYK
jgi:hypothetical protein